MNRHEITLSVRCRSDKLIDHLIIYESIRNQIHSEVRVEIRNNHAIQSADFKLVVANVNHYPMTMILFHKK